ncbi:MAG: polysaccharide pyruvyl transferase CsaB [Acidaminococcaceae bacterium]
MIKILISGYYGFSNAGDEAMLSAIVEALRAKRQDIEITVMSGKPEITAEKHGVNSIHRFNPYQIFKTMLSADLLLSGGGSLLQDVTSKRSILYYLSILLLAKLLGKKVMLYAQGIGPIKSSVARSLTKYVCRKVDLITVRDDGSYEELLEMGLPSERILVTADAVFSLFADNKNIGRQILRKNGLKEEKPIIGIAIRYWTGEQRFMQVFADAALKLRKQYNAYIVFVPLQFPSDTKIAQDVALLMEDKTDTIILKEGYTTEEYVSLISNLDLLIGMRLHALVFSALAGIPFLAVSYDPKVDRFVQGMEGTVAGSIDKITSEDILRESAKLWQCVPYKQNAKIKVLREEAQRNAARAVGLLTK